MINARVLPLPVTASAATSFRSRKSGMVAAWTGVIEVNSSRWRVFMVDWERPREAQEVPSPLLPPICNLSLSLKVLT